ncbi:MAG: hypothetical protein HY329_20250 [Chloroflexi bacterium]|nr:hypothetical protein [Chloroflexota bacterium]
MARGARPAFVILNVLIAILNEAMALAPAILRAAKDLAPAIPIAAKILVVGVLRSSFDHQGGSQDDIGGVQADPARRERATMYLQSTVRPRALFALAFVGLVLTSGCGSSLGSGTLLRAGPATIDLSPNGDRIDDTAEIRYELERDATVSAWLEGANGTRFGLRSEIARTAGEYGLLLNGSVATGDGQVKRQVLPDGQYRWQIVATDGDGLRHEESGLVSIRGADRKPPTLTHVAALPETISPFDPDHQSDTSVTYGLDKTARVVLYLATSDGARHQLTPAIRREPGEYSERWNGQLRNRYLPDGVYGYVLEATDLSGNVVAAGGQIRVVGTARPDARIVRVRIGPEQVIRGELVRVEITVRNTGPVPLRSHGPGSEFVYGSKETFASVAGGQYVDRRGLWRVGVDWAGGGGPEGARYPYRWGFGGELAPGAEATVVGYVRVEETHPQVWFYAGLIQEKIGYYVDRVGTQVVSIGY